MRPPDENQHDSTRPNLLSGARRHVGGDDNILERLERDSARHASGNRSRAAWYAAAASLVLLMIVVLAWSAYDNASAVRVIPMKRAPADSPGAALVPADEPTLKTPPGPAIVQVPETPPASPPSVAKQGSAASALPPLVLLPSQETAPDKTPAVTKPDELASTAAPLPTKPAVRAAPTAPPAAALPRAVPRPPVAARPRKPGAAPVQTDAAVDTDVALLSAIIIHDVAHAEEKAQLDAAAACTRAGASARKCAGRLGAGAGLAN